jgi:hypothetical protein
LFVGSIRLPLSLTDELNGGSGGQWAEDRTVNHQRRSASSRGLSESVAFGRPWETTLSLAGDSSMKAVLEGRMIAESDDIVEGGGYDCVPAAAVRPEPLRQAPRAADDLDFPYGVQFSDLVIDGARHLVVRGARDAADRRALRVPASGRGAPSSGVRRCATQSCAIMTRLPSTL